MSGQVLAWQEEVNLDDRRRIRVGALVSLAIHGLVFVFLVVSPPGPTPPLPEVLSVDLIAALPAPASPAAAPAARPSPPRAAPNPAPAEPAPAPPPPVPAPPAPPKAPVQVIPEESAEKVKPVERKPDVEPEAKPVPQPKPKPRPEPARRAPKPREEAFSSPEDALAALLEDEADSGFLDSRPRRAEPAPAADTESTGAPGARTGVQVSAEMAAWTAATQRRIQSRWVIPASFRGQGLKTTLRFSLSASGDVLGTPSVLVSSGDPFYDDNAVRAVLLATPLPAPPRAGPMTIILNSDWN